jgi:hypothetical protein
MLPPEVVSMTFAMLFTILYMVAMVLLMLTNGAALTWVLGMNGLTGIAWAGLTSTMFLAGAIAYFVVGYLVGWLFTLLWNRMSQR